MIQASAHSGPHAVSGASGIFTPERATGLAVVLALHGALLWGLWQHRLIPGPQEAMTLFVNFIAPPAPVIVPPLPPPPKPRPRPKSKPIDKPKPRQMISEAPVITPSDDVAAAPPPAPLPVIAPPPPAPSPPAAMSMPTGPVKLRNELSVTCPERTAPRYPPVSRRLGETGSVILRVELDEHGKVDTAQVSSSSGFDRLDNAAIEAVRIWQCTPARRNGQPVRAIAVQPFNFILQGS